MGDLSPPPAQVHDSRSNKRVIVNVNGHKFRVPCKEHQSISWLQEDVSRRYERHNKLPHSSVIIAEIRGSDGSLLDSEDCITDAVDDMEELVGVLERLSASSSSTSHVPSALGSFKSHRSDAAAAGPPNRSSEGGGGGGGGGVGAGGGHNTDSYGGGDDAHGRGGGIDEGSMLDASNVMFAGDEQLDLWASDKLRTVCVDGHEDGVTCCHYDGRLLVTGGRDKLVRLWEAGAQSASVVLEGHTSNVRCVQRQNNLVFSGGEPTLRVWDADTGKQTASLEGHAHYVSCLRVDKELRMVSGSWDRTLKIWKVPEDGAETQSLASMEGHTASVLCLETNGDRVASGSLGGEVMVWSLLTGANTLATYGERGTAVNAISWERNLIFCASDVDVKVIDITMGKVVATLQGHTDSITCIIIDMPYILTGSRDSSVKVWSSRTWRCVRTMSCPGIRCLGVGRKTIAAGLDTGELQWWNLA